VRACVERRQAALKATEPEGRQIGRMTTEALRLKHNNNKY